MLRQVLLGSSAAFDIISPLCLTVAKLIKALPFHRRA